MLTLASLAAVPSGSQPSVLLDGCPPGSPFCADPQPASTADPQPTSLLTAASASRPHRIVGWKLKKVGGSSLCAMLERYAASHGLSHHFQAGITNATQSPPGDDPDVVCTEFANADAFPVVRDRDATHILLVREPADQAVSHFYYRRYQRRAEAEGGECGDENYLPTVDEVEESMASYLEEYNFVLPDDFQQAFVGWPGRNPTQQLGDVIDLEFEQYDASVALLEERLDFRIPDIPHEKNCPHPPLAAWGAPQREVLERALNTTRIPAVAAASKARFRAACRASAACNAVMELQVLGGEHARRAWADS